MAIKTHEDARGRTPEEIVHGILDGVYPVSALTMAFIFVGTPYGHDYWRAIADGYAPLDTAARQRLERMYPRAVKKTNWGGYLDKVVIPVLAERFKDKGNTAATVLRLWAQKGVDAAIQHMRGVERGVSRPVVEPGEYVTKDGGRAVILEVLDGAAFGRYRDLKNHTWWATKWDVDTGRGSMLWKGPELRGMDLAERLP